MAISEHGSYKQSFSTTACTKQGETMPLVPVHPVGCKTSQNSSKQNATAKTDNIESG